MQWQDDRYIMGFGPHYTYVLDLVSHSKDTDLLIALPTELQRLYSTSQDKVTAVVTLVVLLVTGEN